jgi:steroid delta-isomerase-like uncharacterized protein
MTNDDIRTFIRAHVGAWVRRDVDALVADYADDCELASPMFRAVRGKSGVEASYRDLFRGFSEWAIEIDDVLIDREKGDRAVMLTRANALQVGEMFGFPPSGRRFEINAVQFYRFENGRIASERRLYDFSGMLIQLGILKAKTGN